MEQPLRLYGSESSRWDQAYEDMEAELDDGIRDTVRLLMGNGFYVFESRGDNDVSTSFVRMLCEPEEIHEEAIRLQRVLSSIGLDAYASAWESDSVDAPRIEIVFRPPDAYAVISLYCLDDSVISGSMEY